jgi:hypothetical protein
MTTPPTLPPLCILTRQLLKGPSVKHLYVKLVLPSATLRTLRAFLVSCGFAHARGIGPHMKFHVADDTQFPVSFFTGCVTVLTISLSFCFLQVA